MNLEEFIAEKIKDLGSFKKYWNAERLKNPSYFLLELDPGEWHEQFTTWLINSMR